MCVVKMVFAKKKIQAAKFVLRSFYPLATDTLAFDLVLDVYLCYSFAFFFF